jgi:ubiquitin-like-conjugating enzyme ATG3
MSGDESKTKPYLPKDKQFLITRNVPCERRCKQMEYVGQEVVVEETDQDGGWVETHHFDELNSSGVEEKICEMTLDSKKIDEMTDETKAQSDNESNDGEDEDEAIDMEEFEESGMLESVDPATATTTREELDKQQTKSSASGDDTSDQVVHTRTYDLHITYDKYYQTPRLWVVGYDENRKPLTMEQMYEDVSQDHAKKTVTMEQHPNLPGPNMASVHPCK